MKEKYSGLSKPQSKILHGEILPPLRMISEERMRDIFITMNNYLMSDAPPPIVFIECRQRHRDFGEEVVETVLIGIELLGIAAFQAAQTYFRNRREKRQTSRQQGFGFQ